MSKLFEEERFKWFRDENIRPYVFVRPENKIKSPGALHSLDWFPHPVIYKNPLRMEEVHFGNQILDMEGRAFGPSGMAMPRWVFYDCSVVPGFVAGFAARTESLHPEVRKALSPAVETEWTPLSLFIIIPTMSREGEWVAHNLCSVNSLIEKKHRFYGLGFLSKAFGLWYANVNICCGFTQWGNPAVKLHSYYGEFEVLTAYTPIHSHARTLTYRVQVNPAYWPLFFTKGQFPDFLDRFESAGFQVDPRDDESLKSFQKRLEHREGPFYLRASEVVVQDLTQPLQVYRSQIRGAQ